MRNLHELPSADVVAICDANEKALRLVQQRYPALATTTEFEEILADPTIEAVAIATPVSTHFPLAEAALDAGKHVMVEKPLAGSSIEAERLLSLAATRGLAPMPGILSYTARRSTLSAL